jgi:hypothetical protein
LSGLNYHRWDGDSNERVYQEQLKEIAGRKIAKASGQ